MTNDKNFKLKIDKWNQIFYFWQETGESLIKLINNKNCTFNDGQFISLKRFTVKNKPTLILFEFKRLGKAGALYFLESSPQAEIICARFKNHIEEKTSLPRITPLTNLINYAKFSPLLYFIGAMSLFVSVNFNFLLPHYQIFFLSESCTHECSLKLASIASVLLLVFFNTLFIFTLPLCCYHMARKIHTKWNLVNVVGKEATLYIVMGLYVVWAQYSIFKKMPKVEQEVIINVGYSMLTQKPIALNPASRPN